MAEPGAGAWWDASWNPAGGCRPVSPGCTNCYAPRVIYNYSRARRWWANTVHANVIEVVNGIPVFNKNLSAARPGHPLWSWPRRWAGAEHPLLGPGKPSLIFAFSLSDLFIPGRPKWVIDLTCATLATSKQLGLILSKPVDRMADYFGGLDPRTVRRWQPKLWLGFSAERQIEFDRRWPYMRRLADDGWFTFVSIAPMLKPITLPSDFLQLGNRTWVIVSGDQGPHKDCRDLHPNWARAIRDQSRAAGIPFFMKQMARLKPIPPDLWSQEFPDV
jgi:protein gp37